MICEKTHTQLLLGDLAEKREESPSQNENEMPLEKTEAKEDARLRRNRLRLEWYYLHRESVKASRKAHYHANKESYRAKKTEWHRIKRQRLGVTVKKIRKIGTVTDEMRRLDQRKAGARYRDLHRENLRAMWRRFAKKKKQMAEQIPGMTLIMAKRRANYDRMYRKREKAKRKQWDLEYKERNKNNPNFILRIRLRARLRTAILKRYGKKSAKTMDLIGCTVAEAVRHIESLFTEGMSWERFSEIAAFDLTDPAQQRLCFRLSNLRPMWHLENLRKGAKCIIDHAPQFSEQLAHEI